MLIRYVVPAFARFYARRGARSYRNHPAKISSLSRRTVQLLTCKRARARRSRVPRQTMADTTVSSLRKSLCSEETPLAVRFRALFSLKHVAQTDPASAVAAIEAIAAGFASPSALLKHELAYCLGQSGNPAAVKPLRDVLSDVQEDAMCRHEAAEALGALGTADNLDVLKQFRDREGEEVVVKETCEIAIDRIEWENSKERQAEKLRQR